MFGFIVALVSGALMSIQGVFNTEVTKQTGTWLTNSFVQFTGFLLCLVIWFFKERKKHPPMEIFAVEPKYYLLGGVIRGIYYLYCNCRDVHTWTGKGSYANCSSAAYCSLPY